jgi:hypothetical protein
MNPDDGCWANLFDHHDCGDGFAGCPSFLATAPKFIPKQRPFLDNGEPFKGNDLLFRSERDNGCLGRLSGYKSMTRIYTPPKFSEIRISHLRRLAFVSSKISAKTTSRIVRGDLRVPTTLVTWVSFGSWE